MLEHEIFQELNFSKTNLKNNLCFYKYTKNAYFIILLENDLKDGFKLFLSKEVKEIDLNRIFIREIHTLDELKDIWKILAEEELVILEQKNKEKTLISENELLLLVKKDLNNKITALKTVNNNNTVFSIDYDELSVFINDYDIYELSGEKARSIGFGVVIKKEKEVVFLETDKEKIEEFDS